MKAGNYVAPESLDELKNEIVFLSAVLDAIPCGMASVGIKRVMRRLYPEPTCHYCGIALKWAQKAGEHNGVVTLDHIIPQSKGGLWRPWNLLIACQPCNFTRGNMDYEQFMKRARELADARGQHEQAA